ncbi:MAG: hypothetical protein HHAS10_06540 [Candidatus Altimarinota bacterium]
MRKIHLIGIFLAISLSGLTQSFAVGEGSRISMGVSPIRHDFTVERGQTVTKEVSFFNNADVPYNIYVTAEDCVTDDGAGTPKCRENQKSGPDPDSVSSWISYDSPESFVVPPHSEKKIQVIVKAPNDALPGGHYGAIFFNNPEGSDTSGNTVKMVKRTGILLLVNVPGKIVYDTIFGDIGIELSSAPKSQPNDWISKLKRDLDPRITPPVLVQNDFGMNFNIPVTNNGNTHILPVGRIELYDDELLLKRIGKESIRSEDGVLLGEKIVDYLPINDEAGNVLPSSNRLYTVLWKGFAYEDLENDKKVIKFLSPSEYYSRKSGDTAGYLLPWEKLKIIDATKIIKAKIHLEYRKTDGAIEPFESEQDINIRYSYIDKGINWGALILIATLLLIIWILWLLFRKDEERVDELEYEVEELEGEIDELEKGRQLAKAALAKKKKSKAVKALDGAEKKVTSTRKKSATTDSNPSQAQKSPTKRTTKVTDK